MVLGFSFCLVCVILNSKGVMMKKLITLIIFAILLMIGGPIVALQFPGVDAMGVCFLLFYAINPVFLVVCGAISGANVKRLWAIPLIDAVLFLAGVWLLFDMGEIGFVFYSVCYLIIGYLAMGITALICKFKRKAQ